MDIYSREYTYLHLWLKKNYGKANKCANKDCRKNSKIYEWAKIKDKTYSYDINNFMMLCRKCHKNYDATSKYDASSKFIKSAITILKLRKSLSLDQDELAKALNVTKTAIYNWEKGLRVPKDTQKRNIINFAHKHKMKVKLEEFYND